MGYIDPTEDAILTWLRAHGDGPVDMLNLLRFREVADYSASPELAPDDAISGAEAYRTYERHTLPFLTDAGGEVLYAGDSVSGLLIGPTEERWDHVLVVRHRSPQAFISFASNEAYLAGIGHRTAALEDSRLLPMQPSERRRDVTGGETGDIPRPER